MGLLLVLGILALIALVLGFVTAFKWLLIIAAICAIVAVIAWAVDRPHRAPL